MSREISHEERAARAYALAAQSAAHAHSMLVDAGMRLSNLPVGDATEMVDRANYHRLRNRIDKLIASTLHLTKTLRRGKDKADGY